MNKRMSGFTLVELMVTIAVIGIMAAIAFPNMRDFVNSARINNRTEQIGNLFRFAKGEAVRLNQPVIICGVRIRSDGRAVGTCNNNQIQSGMMAYADVNRNGIYDTGVDMELRTINLNNGVDAVTEPNKVRLRIRPAVYALNVSGSVTPAATPPEFIFLPTGVFGIKPNANNLIGMEFSNRYVTFQVHDNTKYSNMRNLQARIVTMNPNGAVEICKDRGATTASVSTPKERILQTICLVPKN